MNTQEIAIKYGVPMPETSMKLDWQGETNFYWGYFRYSQEPTGNDLIPRLLYYVGVEDGKKQFIVVKECHHLLNLIGVQSWERINPDERDYEIYPAPQMHEIAPLLPPKIEGFLEPMYLDLVSAPYHNKSCFFLQYTGVKSKKDYFTSMRIDDFHFAQPYAELYLKLKNEGIIR